MTDTLNNVVMNAKGALPTIFEGETIEEIRLHRKRMLLAAFRLFGKFGSIN